MINVRNTLCYNVKYNYYYKNPSEQYFWKFITTGRNNPGTSKI